MNARHLAASVLAFAAVASFNFSTPLIAAAALELSRVSVASDGSQAIGGGSGGPHVSSNGRFVVFSSGANNLVTGDTNFRSDVFLHDRVASTTERVSVGSDEQQGNGSSFRPSVSADGRYVAFMSNSTNWTPTTNNELEVFVRDRVLGTTERGSPSLTDGPPFGTASAPMISANGRFVTYQSHAGNLVPTSAFGEQIYLYDRQTRTTERVSVADDGTPANRGAFMPTISGDGRYVAFFSYFSDNLVPGDTNNQPDVFVRDRLAGQTRLVSRAEDGTLGNGQSWDPVLSEDGRWVAFPSYASNLVPGDTNNFTDAFVKDLQTGTIERVSVSTSGAEAWGIYPVISAGGRYIAFESGSDKLVPGPTGFWGHVYLRDRSLGTTVRLSQAPDGSFANRNSSSAAISADGTVVAFVSGASNLIADDSNGQDDIYVAAERVDSTPPMVSSVVTPAPNADGWNHTPTTVSWTLADPESGIASSEGCATVTIAADTASMTIQCSATNGAGLTTTSSATVHVDTTAPFGNFGTHPTSYDITETIDIHSVYGDALSGVASVTGTTDLTAPAYNLGLGEHSLTLTIVDRAGNSTTISTSFAVTQTYDSLCALSERFSDSDGIDKLLCAKLRVASLAEIRGLANAKAIALDGFQGDVRRETGRSLAAEEAAILIELAGGF